MPATASIRTRPLPARLGQAMSWLCGLLLCAAFAQNGLERYGDTGNETVLAWRRMLDEARPLTVDDKLQAVNQFFNRRLRFTTDQQTWGMPDYWATPPEFMRQSQGDCEDFAIAKYVTLRLQADGASQLLSSSDFMPIASTLHMSAPVDLAKVRLALAALGQSRGDIALNLAAESLRDFSFQQQLTALLKQQPQRCWQLLFEVAEFGVSRQLGAFRELALRLKALGCKVGIDLFGQRFVESNSLASLGLDYIKVDPAYVRGIGASSGNQEFLDGLCTMAHTLGIAVIASGVEQAGDLELLGRLGFDGATGPGIKQNEPS